MLEQVKNTRPEFLQAITQMEKEAFGDGGMNEWHLVPLIRHGRVYIWRENQKITGSIQYMLDWEHLKRAYLYGVAIRGNCRGQGMGTRLIANSLILLFEEGIQEVELTVDPANEGAIRLYEQVFGFVRTGFRKEEYGPGEDRITMTLMAEEFKKRQKAGNFKTKTQ